MELATTTPDITQIRLATEKVLASKLFQTSPALSRLLSFLCESHGERLSEYAIAIDGLGRRSDFDPAAESTVRVQVKRLRERLDTFYTGEGKDETVRIHIPLGTHHLAVRFADQTLSIPGPESASVVHPTVPVSTQRSFSRMQFAFISAVLLAVAVLGLWTVRTVSAGHADTSNSHLSGIWSDIFRETRTARIIIPSPVFFAWKSSSGDRLMVRDTEVNDYSGLERSGKLASLSSSLGRPEMVQAYTAAPDTFAALKLVQYLNHHAIDAVASPDGDPSVVSQTGENVILIGTPRTLAPYSMYFQDLDFVMDTASGTVRNLQPTAQEQGAYWVVEESSERKRSPAIVAVVPLHGSHARMLIVLSSFDTAGVINYLTSENGVNDLEGARQRARTGDFFSAIVETESKGDVSIHSSVVALHARGRVR